MNGLDFLDLVIGLIFIYLIYSIACSTIWEIIINVSHLRGRMLYTWLKVNFNKGELYDKIAGHALVKGMSKAIRKNKEHQKPSYISSGVFTDVLMDLIVNEDKSSPTHFDINSFKTSLEKTNLLDDDLKRVFIQYITEASGNLQTVKEKIGNWFDETQERLIGFYKKNVQWWIFVISMILVGATNADTFNLANYLYNNDDARKAIADNAVVFVRDTTILSKIKANDTAVIDSAALRDQREIVAKIYMEINTIKELYTELNEASIPLGWAREELKQMCFWDIIKKIGGLLLTVFAVSLGSPFWFDILSKMANLRSSGNKPKSSLDPEAGK